MSSHVDCDHPVTKVARAQCRRMRDATLRGVRNSKTAQQLELARSESSTERLAVTRRTLTRDRLFAGIWVRLRRSDDGQWQSGYLVSAMHDNIRVSLDNGEWIEFNWEDHEYEMEQEIYRLEVDRSTDRRRRSRYNGS
jgi:hypothetical protein